MVRIGLDQACRFVFAAIVLLLFPSVALADATVTAKGYAFCYDGTNQSTVPLEGVRVELMDSDCDGSEICDDVMGVAYVQADGSFTVTGSGGDPGWIGSDPDVYIRFAYNDDKGVRLTDEADITRSWNTPEHEHDNFGGGTIDFGTWVTGVGAGPAEGTRCGVWRQGHTAFRDYLVEMGAQPPAGHLDIEYWSAIFAGTPWTNTDTIHWPIHYRSDALTHEFGHSVRHAGDGDAAHFSYDVGRFAYARTHAVCDPDGNKNGGESDDSRRGYAFNEGWAEYWESRGCADNATPAEFREGAVARHLRELQTKNGLKRKDMVAVLQANPGQIHSLGEYESAFAKLHGVAVSHAPLMAEGNVGRDAAPLTPAQRQRALAAISADVDRRVADLTLRSQRYRQQPFDAETCRVCEATFTKVTGPALLEGQARALQIQLTALKSAASPTSMQEADASLRAGRFDAFSQAYGGRLRRELIQSQAEALRRARADLQAARGRFSPGEFDAAASALAKAQTRLASLSSAGSGDRAAGWIRTADLPEDAARLRAGAPTPPAYPGRATLDVPASQLWKPTGVRLVRGQGFDITAKGQWSNSGPPAQGPAGFANTRYPGTLAPTANLASLIGRIGDRIIPLGADYSGTSPADGELFLSINDTPATFADNQGSLSVRVQKH